MDVHATALLLPKPKRIERRTGHCRIDGGAALHSDLADARIERAFGRIMRMLPSAPVGAGRTEVRMTVDAVRVIHRVGYQLDIGAARVDIVGGSAAGCFYGLQTLSQLIHASNGDVPCVAIEDYPDLAVRGVLHDITRGKMPTLATLKRLVDRLSSWKINQLQLYIEHAFLYSFDPDICDADHGLTPDEAQELEAYAKERFITLVPAVATLGHMGRILSMPRFRHLAEVPAAASWEETDWPRRARGLTLDPTQNESRELVRRIWTDVLDAFSSPVVNICGDEPWDLGKGAHTKSLTQEQLAEIYVDHIRYTHDICALRGRRCQLWSDVIRLHPEQLSRLPRDLTVLHWGYDEQADYAGTRSFVERNYETVVCSGTSGWKRIINGISLAERNISTFARAAKEYRADGLLNTDWGDHGHFNPLACSWHGLAVGAACAWSNEHDVGPGIVTDTTSFDDRFIAQLVAGSIPFTPAQSIWVRLLRKAAAMADRHDTWRLLWMSADAIRTETNLPSVDQLERAIHASRKFATAMDRAISSAPEDSTFRYDAEELAIAARFQELLAQKLILIQGFAGREVDSNKWADRLIENLKTYEAIWLRHNKPSGLPDIIHVLRRVAAEMREHVHAR